jgi:hypothetical protein
MLNNFPVKFNARISRSRKDYHKSKMRRTFALWGAKVPRIREMEFKLKI